MDVFPHPFSVPLLSRFCDSSVTVLMIELYWEDGVQPALRSNFSVEVVLSKIALSVFPYKGGYIHLPFLAQVFASPLPERKKVFCTKLNLLLL